MVAIISFGMFCCDTVSVSLCSICNTSVTLDFSAQINRTTIMEKYTAITGNTLLDDSSLGSDLHLRNGTSGYSKYMMFYMGNDGFGQEGKEGILGGNS